MTEPDDDAAARWESFDSWLSRMEDKPREQSPREQWAEQRQQQQSWF